MSKRIRSMARLATLLAVLAAPSPVAWGFYPFGFFDAEQGGALVYVRWPLSVLDVNGDGDVSGEDDGAELNFEVGNGEDGFSTAEADKIFSGFSEWELVSTCYVAYRRGPDISDPVELSNDITQIDSFNMVAYESVNDVAENGSVTEGFVWIMFPTYALQDTVITVGNETFTVQGGRFLDNDTIYAADSRDAEAQASGFLEAISVPAGGIFMGLDWSPLTNFDENASEIAGIFVENRVVALRNANGNIGLRGVTSSMFNSSFVYDDGGGNFTWADGDLAPDDIAGITFMYPRNDLDIFFDLNQRARTQASADFISAPLSGSWIRAWCDVDKNNGTSRVPFIDTLTGLYYDTTSPSFAGHFQLKNLFKQLETINEETFAATYAVTSSEFLPLALADDLTVYDSTHGGFLDGGADNGIQFSTLFPAEVFNENGNLFSLNNVNQGTSLVFDLKTRKIISATSGKTLDVILATGRPMFGEQDQVCPLNVVVGMVGGPSDLANLRRLRDNALLTSALGVAVTDTYYRIAPAIVSVLSEYPIALSTAEYGYVAAAWTVRNAEYLLLLTASALLVVAARRRRVTHA